MNLSSSVRKCGFVLFCLGTFSLLREVECAETATNHISAIVSYQYSESVTTSEATGGVISPIVSYQLQDSLAHDNLISPGVSYQYFERLDEGVLNSLTSPTASYFWDAGIFGPSLTLSGRVFDANFLPIENATVTVSVIEREIARTATGPDGAFSIPSLPQQRFTVTASKQGFLFDSRVIQLTPVTQVQNFLLRPPPGAVNTITTGSTPPIVYRPAPPSTERIGTLKIFDPNTFNFIPAPLALPQKTTVVFTHGWISNPDQWPSNMAKAMILGSKPIEANILAWDWREVASPSVQIDGHEAPSAIPEFATIEEGIQLGEAIYERLGSLNTQELHFIGHSLGALVNRYAADYVHGNQFGDRKVPVAWAGTKTHLTLLDEAELARTVSYIENKAVNGFSSETVALYGKDALDWKSPIPFDHGWIDNYISAYGLPKSSAFNILLDYGVLVKFPPPLGNVLYNEGSHGYAHLWYLETIKRPGLSLAGFRHSPEFHQVDPIRSGAFPPGDFLATDHYARQIQPCFSPPCFLTEDQELELDLAQNSSDFFAPALGGDPRTLYNSAQTAFRNTTDFIADTAAESVRITQNAVVTTYGTTKAVVTDVYENVKAGAVEIKDRVVDLGSTVALRVELALRNLLPLKSGGKMAAAPPELWEHATLPLAVPSDATFFVFDFRVSGDAGAATIVFGINETNLFTLPAQFVTVDVTQSSRVYDATALAGRTNEFFFGFTGQTSTSCTLVIENIRFYSVIQPKLSVETTPGGIRLTWPSHSEGYALESSPTMAPDSWSPVAEPPTLFNSQFSRSFALGDTARFFRLRR